MTRKGRLENIMTEGDVLAQLLEHLRMAQEAAATISHHRGMNDDTAGVTQWLAVAEQFRKTQHIITAMATRRMN